VARGSKLIRKPASHRDGEVSPAPAKSCADAYEQAITR
jgi:hypothetical protein